MSSDPAEDVKWLVDSFAARSPGVSHAAVMSADGLIVAVSSRLPDEGAEQLAAIACGLAGLAHGTAELFDGRQVRQLVIEMERGYFIVMSLRDRAVLAVLASNQADIGVIGYEMARLCARAGELLTPGARTAAAQ